MQKTIGTSGKKEGIMMPNKKYYHVEDIYHKLGFGKYANKSYLDVWKDDPAYILWAEEKYIIVSSMILVEFREKIDECDGESTEQHIQDIFYFFYNKEKEEEIRRNKEILEKYKENAREEREEFKLRRKTEIEKEEKRKAFINKIKKSTSKFIKYLSDKTDKNELKWKDLYSITLDNKRTKLFACDSSRGQIILKRISVSGLRESCEMYLGNDLIIQEVLNEESDFCRLWNLIHSKEKERKRSALEKEKSIPRIKIKYRDCVCCKNDFYCEKNHSVEDIIAIIDVCNQEGKICQESLAAGYCKNCDKYFVLRGSIDNLLRKKLAPLCEFSGYYKNEECGNGKYNALNTKSKLYLLNYNVSKKIGYTTQQRWGILETIIKENKMTQKNVLSYLYWYLDTRKEMMNMDEAIAKWTEDAKHIENYKVSFARKIAIKG